MLEHMAFKRLVGSAWAAGLLVSVSGSASVLAQVPRPDRMLWGMPDIDQRRDGLISSGNSHCVPTSHINMLLYIQKQSVVPLSLVPNVQNPQLNSEHQDLTDELDNLGELMNVFPDYGTSLVSAQAGLEEYLGDNGSFLIRTYKLGTITRGDLYWTLASGGLVSFAYGRWNFDTVDERYERDGGHCVTLMGVEDFFSPAQPSTVEMQLIYRDPWTDDGDLSKQSLFTSIKTGVRSSFGVFKGFPLGSVFLEIIPESPSDTRRLIDGVSYIYPIFALKQSTPGLVSIFPAFQLHPFQPAATPEVQLNGILEVAQSLTPTSKFATELLLTGNTQLSLIDFAEGRNISSTTILGRATKIAAGRRGEVYVVGGGQLRCLALDQNERLVDGPPPLNFPSTPDAMAYNDDTDELAVFAGNQISEFDRTLPAGVNPQIRLFAVPPTFASSTRRMIVGNGATREYWFGPLADGSIKAYQPDAAQPLRMTLTRTIAIPGGSSGITDFAIDDSGNPYFLRNGAVQALRLNPQNQRWETDTQNPFNGLNLGGLNVLSISRSRTNFDPAIHDNPGWNSNIPTGDVLGPSTLDCLADIGRQGAEPLPDGILDNNDFVVFIRLFFAADEAADIASQGAAEGPDGAFDNNDFVVFIQRFFTPCN